FTLNLFSLLALTLAVSIVVDDAIMLLENIVRHHRLGKTSAQAAYDGAMEILPAATAATLAVVAVFLPVIFMEGVTGKFFFQFGITMSAAVLLSLLEAVTITPMRAAALLSRDSKTSALENRIDSAFERVSHSYRRWLDSALTHSWKVVLGSMLLFIVSLFVVRAVNKEFVPAQDQDIILLSGQTPAGSSLPHTFDKALEVESLLKKSPWVKNLFISAGAGGPAAEVNQFFIPVYLAPRKERPLSHTEIMDELRKGLKSIQGVRVTMRDMSSRGLTAGRMYPVSFNLKGPDLEVLRAKAEEISQKLMEEGLGVDMDTDFKMGVPELLIQPDRDAMAARGVAVSSVSRTLNATVAGVRQSRFTSGGHRYDIRVKLPQDRIHSPDDIKNIDVRNNYGIRVPLASLVTLKEKATYQSINRVNRQRTVGVFGNVAKGKGQGQVLARAEALARENLPDGYTLSLEGSAAGLNESFQSLTIALLLGILVAYMILAVQFNSFVHPISVLVALPFSVTGALLSLWIFGVSLNLFSFIGLIVLMGIAKKNSILLVEFTNQVRARGATDVRQALLEACPVRLRPILMTSAATVAAALPLVIGTGIGQETRTPMGLTIIGGTVVSTFFTLFVVPGLYGLLTKIERGKATEVKV
ncbi:MAG: efflux RND transporter permease subunit, partial [Bdellovibrionales bacterium]|nr:efflux RND transporter permease subunit [Bdellovibrionales bacterium]